MSDSGRRLDGAISSFDVALILFFLRGDSCRGRGGEGTTRQDRVAGKVPSLLEKLHEEREQEAVQNVPYSLDVHLEHLPGSWGTKEQTMLYLVSCLCPVSVIDA